jgi:hypothetical protein
MINNLTRITVITLMVLVLFSVVSPMTASAADTGGFWDDFDVTIEEGEDGAVNTGESENQGFGALIESLKEFIVGIAGVATVIAVGFFIFNFIKLGGSNSRTRSEAISGLIYSGIATAGLGSVTLITAMFYGMIG